MTPATHTRRFLLLLLLLSAAVVYQQRRHRQDDPQEGLVKYYGQDPATRGFVIEIASRDYAPENLSPEYWRDSLRVQVVYELTGDQAVLAGHTRLDEIRIKRIDRQ